MSGYLPRIKQQLELETTSESLLNPELNLAVGVIVCSDQIQPLLIHQDLQNLKIFSVLSKRQIIKN
jgi:hypothetical protein